MEHIIKKIGLLLVIIALLSLSSIIVAIILSFSGESLLSGNVAVIPITGVITSGDDGWSSTVNPDFVRKAIDKADKDSTIKAIVLEINSPGGSAVASDEIGQAVKRTNKTTVAWIREVGASGGYWIASNTDYIIANRMSITGSVGVTASYIDFAGTLKRYNATYEQLTGGEYKEAGTPFKELSTEERQLLQKKIDMIHEFFLAEVQENRNLTNETMKKIRTGEFFLGVEAKKLNLVDELGSYNELQAYLNKTIGEEPLFVAYNRPKTLIEELGFVKSSFFPQTKLELRT